MPCNYRANGCNVWMSVHAERNLSYAKIIYIIKKSKFGKDVLKAATGERQHNSLAVNALQNGLFHVAKQAILHGETTYFAMLND